MINQVDRKTLPVQINGRNIGPGFPTYIVAEISANHNQDIEEAVALIHAAKEAGADAIKLQTYTPDTLTIESAELPFQIKGGLWDGRTLYDLYKEAYTPWEWHPRLIEEANKIGITAFSSPFDITAVDFLDDLNVPAFKIASFEMVDIPLIKHIAKKGKPVIMSTGMATLAEIDDAIKAIRNEGNEELIVLHCVSAYPAPAEEMHLRTIPHLAQAFGAPTGLSDHSLGTAVAVGSVALGACMIEKHFILDRSSGGPDSSFSIEQNELAQMVNNIRTLEKALGTVQYDVTEEESKSLVFRRSLFVVEDIKKGERLTEKNVRSIRPGFGLPSKYIEDIMGLKAARDISRGSPLKWDLLGG